MKVSVVLSTYNGQEFILQQLDSIRMQSFKANEVLIVDDCSSDNTPEIVQKYIKKYDLKDWKFKVNSQNKGWRRNFMELMWSASGDIIFTCDQDDIWYLDKIKKMHDIMEKNPKIKLLTSNYLEFFDDGKEIRPKIDDQKIIKEKLENNYLLVKYPGCTHCIRKSLVDISKKYWENDYPHDALMWRLAIFDGGLYNVREVLIKWRRHRESTFAIESRNLKTVSEKKKWIKVAKQFQRTLKKYLKKDVLGNIEKQEKILNRCDRWLFYREKFYDTKNILYGIYLMRYWNCYPRYRQYLLDWYLIYIKGDKK